MNDKKIVMASMFVIIVAIMIETIGLGTVSNASATITSTGLTDEQNNCGNDKLSLRVFCQNVESEVQGSDDAIFVNATQPSN